LLGNTGDFDAIVKLAQKHKLILIEDTAQAPGSRYKGKSTGAWGAAGVFSFQETKNVMTGEGGMITTNDPQMAEKCRMIRNHGESIPVQDDGDSFVKNVIGYNFRMQEPIAALGWAQTKKLKALNKIRRINGLYLYKQLEKHFENALHPQRITNPEHFSPYCLGMRWNADATGLHRNLVAAALRAEGIPVSTGFPRLMSENILFTRNSGWNGRDGLPNATNLQYRDYLGFFQVGWPNTTADMDDIVNAFDKILLNKKSLLDSQLKANSLPQAYSSGRR
jgi:dTDP-4-amino-4,6-dideoxygalactose transaminase